MFSQVGVWGPDPKRGVQKSPAKDGQDLACKGPTREPRRAVFATAGHVDHGKTALIRALTGVETDRLPEEKRRGISIELGFAELGAYPMSFIDVPGHRRLVHAMIAGVGGVDAVLLVVAADDGVMPQTREHLYISKLLGIDRIVVALTKADLVDAETLELAGLDLQGALESIGLSARAVVATSAETGQGLPELQAALIDAARAVPARRGTARLWLPIDRVFTVKGTGTVVTGTLTRGSLTVGAPLFIAGPRGVRETASRALEVHGRPVESVEAPARVAVNLARIERQEVNRGEVLTSDERLAVSRRLDVALTRVAGTEDDLRANSPVVIHLGTTRAHGKYVPIDEGLAQVTLEVPVPAQGGVGIVLRGFKSDRLRGAVLGGGRILDAAPAPLPRRKDRQGWEHRAALLRAAREGSIEQLVSEALVVSAPRPANAADLERRFGLEPGAVAASLSPVSSASAAPSLAPVALGTGGLWTTAGALEALAEELIEAVARHHRTAPDDPGAPLETLRAALASKAGREAADEVIARGLHDGRLVRSAEGLVRLPSFAAQSDARFDATADQVSGLLARAAADGITEATLAAESGASVAAVRAALSRLASMSRARRLGGLWFAETELDRVREAVKTFFASRDSMSVSDFKTITGVTRKQAIPLLEQLDREATTKRVGDLRVLGTKGR